MIRKWSVRSWCLGIEARLCDEQRTCIVVSFSDALVIWIIYTPCLVLVIVDLIVADQKASCLHNYSSAVGNLLGFLLPMRTLASLQSFDPICAFGFLFPQSEVYLDLCLGTFHRWFRALYRLPHSYPCRLLSLPLLSLCPLIQSTPFVGEVGQCFVASHGKFWLLCYDL